MLIRIISLVVLFGAISISSVVNTEDVYFIYPQKKPSVFKKINKKILPIKKPKSNKNTVEIKKSFTLPKDKPIKKEKKIATQKTQIIKKEIEKFEKKEILVKNVVDSKFIYPKKKPKSYKSTIKESKTSSVLSKKDFARAKEIFKLIKARKWNSALKSSKRIKDKEFKNLITWMYLKQRGNQATFADYQIFITKNNDYPRINRLRYLSEHKIFLKNTTPAAVINWFEKEYKNFGNEGPLSGVGKLKLGEAYILAGDSEKAIKLIKEGWINAELSKSDLRYYR